MATKNQPPPPFSLSWVFEQTKSLNKVVKLAPSLQDEPTVLLRFEGKWKFP